MLGLADALEERTEELAELEATNAGKPINAFRDDEIPFMVDNLRFFAGAARVLEGKAAGEYLEGHTSFIRREPVGVDRPDRALELPADDGGVEVRPGAGHRQHDRAQAGRDHADDHRAAGRDRGRVPARRACSTWSAATATWASASSATTTWTWSRITGSVESGKRVAEVAAETLKRVHLELGGKAPVVVFDDADMAPAMETIAGTAYYNAGQDCTAATRVLASAASTTTSSTASPSRRAGSCSATPSPTTPRSGR